MKLLPDLSDHDEWRFDVQVGARRWLVTIKVQERARYTTGVLITQENTLEAWAPKPQVQVALS